MKHYTFNKFLFAATVCAFLLASEHLAAQRVGDRVVVTATVNTKILRETIETVYGGEIDTVTEVEDKWCALSRTKGWLPTQYVMNLDKGEEYYSKRIDRDDKDFDAWATRGMIRFELERYNAAIKDLSKSIGLNPGNAVTFNNRAIVLNAIGRYPEAMVNLDQAIKLYSDYADAHENKGLVFVSLANYPEAIKSFDRAIELRDDNPWAYINRGSAKSNSGDFQSAKADFLKALSLDEDISDAYVGLNVVYLAENDYEKAMQFAAQALKKNPRNGLAFNQRGWTHYKQGKLEKAIADFNQGIRYAPKLSILFSNRGICYTDKANYLGAIKDFNRSLALNPNSPVTLMNRGAAYMADKKFKKATADLSKAVKLAPKLGDAANAYGWFLATCPDDGFRNGEEAKKQAEVACEASKWKEWSYIDTLAAAEAELGNFDTAVKHEQKAIELAPDSAKAACTARLEMYNNQKPYRSQFGKLSELK